MLNLPLALGGLTGWGGSGCCPPTRHHSRPGPRGWRGSQRPCTCSCSSSLPFRFPRLPFIISHLRLISLGLFPSLLSQSLPFSFFPSRAPCPNVRERAHILPSTPCARCALALVSCPHTMCPTFCGPWCPHTLPGLWPRCRRLQHAAQECSGQYPPASVMFADDGSPSDAFLRTYPLVSST